MHNVWLIARREYLERIRTRGFLITTITIPLIMGGFLLGSTVLGTKPRSSAHIAIVSSDTRLALDLQAQLEQQTAANSAGMPAPRQASAAPARLGVDTLAAGPDTRSTVNRELASGDLDGYLWITPAATPGVRPRFALTARTSDQSYLKGVVASALSTVLLRERLAHSGVVASEADAMLRPVEIETVRAPRHTDTDSAEVSIGILFFVMYFVIMLYGMNVARSIIEEKNSRIFEVLLATIRPEEMMAGKILGVGSVGLTQAGIWLAALVLGGSSIAGRLGAANLRIGLTTPQLIYFFVYFLLGYAFYSSIAAALGAMTNSEQELQQLNMFLVMPLAFCFIVLYRVLANPDANLARVLALIPPFTPLLMYLRVSLGHPAAWEIALSIALTSASILGIVWVTSRIYRVGVLMYGKRPSLPEILRWLKYT